MTARLGAVLLAFVAGVTSPDVAASVVQRDVTSAPGTGTGEIRGVVQSEDAAPAPIRRAIVTVSGGAPAVSRSVLTDDDGRFAFARLPEGRFSVSAKKAAYLPTAYGAMKPGRQGSELVLAGGQRMSISLTMWRGAVISGTLRDESGAPLTGLSVSAYDVHGPNTPDNLSATVQGAVTDDRGTYRFFGLMPSEYVIAASPVASVAGTVGSRAEGEMDAVLAELARRHPGGVSGASPATPAPIPAAPAVGLAPVFYPGTATYADAVRIRVAPGEDRAAVDFPVIPIQISVITGTVSADLANLATVQLSLISSGPRFASMGMGGIIGQPPDADGRFAFGNLPPGPVRIVARARRTAGDPAPNGPGRSGASGGLVINGTPVALPGAPATTPAEMLYGVADVDLRGQDVTGVSIRLQPGAMLSGRVVFDAEHAAVPADPTKLTVGVTLPAGAYTMSNGSVTIGPGIVSVPFTAVRPDGTFEITGIGPAAFRVSCNIPGDLSSVWRLRSAIVGGRDLLDMPMDFTPGQTVKDVVVTLSDKRTEIAGSLQTPTGQPASAYFVVAFPADKALWAAGARRLRSTRPGSDGRFSFADLPAGTYLLATLTDVDPLDWQDPAFLEQVAPAGVTVVLREGEKKIQDLKIVG